MNTTLKIFAFAAMLANPLTAFAQQVEIVLGSGSPGGTYYPVISEIAEFCDSPTLKISHYLDPDNPDNPTGGGSVANLTRITNNLAMGGLVQTDVAALEVLGRNPAMARVLALLPLHTEHVHFVVPSLTNVLVQEAKEGNFLGFGAQEAVYELRANPMRSVADLQGATIASWGGSAVSSQVIAQLARLGATVVNAGSRDAAMAMLDSGQAHAVVSVAGAPVQWISDLPQGEYTLLTVGANTQENLASVYGTQPVSYNNMGANGQRIDALTVNALLMTRTYRTDKMIGALAELQSCVREKIFEIQDTPGTHPAWQMIDPNAEMLWDNIFQAPTRASTVSAPAAADEG